MQVRKRRSFLIRIESDNGKEKGTGSNVDRRGWHWVQVRKRRLFLIRIESDNGKEKGIGLNVDRCGCRCGSADHF